ncbi:MAG: hypothetical protein O3B72_02915 [Proteobacteria bacterium]|nr:hypothetical protein [Pseudomonadota bacterium]
MTINQSEQTRESAKAAIVPFSQRLAQWIDDPFASALLATAATTTAICFVLGGMGIINLILN